MGLLSILKKLKRKENEMRILVLGLDNAGKTTIVKHINGEDVGDIAPTLGFSIKTFAFTVDDCNYNLNMWDVGGQTTLRAYWRNYFEATDCVIWVIDSADVRRLQDCKKELHQLLTQEKLAGATLLIFANKQDLPGALSEKQLVEELELNSVISNTNRHWNVQTCSGTTGMGLLQGLDWAIRDVSSRIFMLD